MIFQFKDHTVSNSLNVFNYYKRLTGNSLEVDLRKLQKLENATGEEYDKILEKLEIDSIETLQYIYYSMRCAAEKKELDLSEIIDELDTEDLINGKIKELITKLIDIKKKDLVKAEKRRFLSRK